MGEVPVGKYNEKNIAPGQKQKKMKNTGEFWSERAGVFCVKEMEGWL